MSQRQIYVGDYVRLNEIYLREWTCETPSRLRDLRNTIFLVIEACRCYNWSYGMGGGGMLLTLKPFAGPLSREDICLGRGEASVEILDSSSVDRIISEYLEEVQSGKDIDAL